MQKPSRADALPDVQVEASLQRHQDAEHLAVAADAVQAAMQELGVNATHDGPPAKQQVCTACTQQHLLSCPEHEGAGGHTVCMPKACQPSVCSAACLVLCSDLRCLHQAVQRQAACTLTPCGLMRCCVAGAAYGPR